MWNPLLKTVALAVGTTLLAIAVGCTERNGRQDYRQATWEERAAKEGHMFPPVEASRRVTIDNFTFDPPTLTIPPGTKVTWVNRDDVPHTATSTAKPKSFDSGALDTDQQFSHVFTKPGTYVYFCAVHPKMTARIVVE